MTPEEAGGRPELPRDTLWTLVAISGGVLVLGLLILLATPPGAASLAAFAAVLTGLGAVGLVGSLVAGAALTRDLSPEGRLALGVLAGVLVVAAALGLFFLATPAFYYYTCGAAVALPSMGALAGLLWAKGPLMARLGVDPDPDPEPGA